MTPEDRKECVATLRGDAAYELDRANSWNEGGYSVMPTPWTRQRAWEHGARANLLAAAADEIEKGTDDATE